MEATCEIDAQRISIKAETFDDDGRNTQSGTTQLASLSIADSLPMRPRYDLRPRRISDYSSCLEYESSDIQENDFQLIAAPISSEAIYYTVDCVSQHETLQEEGEWHY